MRENVYEADEEDAEFLETARCINAGLSMNELEDLIAAIENQARKTIISWPVAQAQLRHISMEKLALVYDYWAEKRRVSLFFSVCFLKMQLSNFMLSFICRKFLNAYLLAQLFRLCRPLIRFTKNAQQIHMSHFEDENMYVRCFALISDYLQYTMAFFRIYAADHYE